MRGMQAAGIDAFGGEVRMLELAAPMLCVIAYSLTLAIPL